jgi:hypothetical protein
LSHTAFTQDIIYKTDGSEIKTKIIEIDETYIKYKNFEQIEGPIRNILKSQVFMIRYQDGIIEKFSTITNKPTETFNPQPKNTKLFSADYIDLQIHKGECEEFCVNDL